jgi:hypothetical protein
VDRPWRGEVADAVALQRGRQRIPFISPIRFWLHRSHRHPRVPRTSSLYRIGESRWVRGEFQKTRQEGMRTLGGAECRRGHRQSRRRPSCSRRTATRLPYKGGIANPQAAICSRSSTAGRRRIPSGLPSRGSSRQTTPPCRCRGPATAPSISNLTSPSATFADGDAVGERRGAAPSRRQLRGSIRIPAVFLSRRLAASDPGFRNGSIGRRSPAF